MMTADTSTGLKVGDCARICAAIPVTCGVAIDVPLMVFVAVVFVDHADIIDDPGANKSTQVPKFEYDAL